MEKQFFFQGVLLVLTNFKQFFIPLGSRPRSFLNLTILALLELFDSIKLQEDIIIEISRKEPSFTQARTGISIYFLFLGHIKIWIQYHILRNRIRKNTEVAVQPHCRNRNQDCKLSQPYLVFLWLSRKDFQKYIELQIRVQILEREQHQQQQQQQAVGTDRVDFGSVRPRHHMSLGIRTGGATSDIGYAHSCA